MVVVFGFGFVERVESNYFLSFHINIVFPRVYNYLSALTRIRALSY